MRGSGKRVFEMDFSPGTDQIKTLSSEPYGKERFEMEMDMRLRYSVLMRIVGLILFAV